MRRLLLIALLAFAARADEVVDNAAVLKMVQAGLSAEIILIKIDHSAARFDTTTDALIALKNANVPDAVIKAMLLAKPAVPVPAAAPAPKAAAAPATDRCLNVKYYTLGGSGWAWTPASVCISASDVSVNEQSIPLNGVTANCFTKSSMLGDAEWWITDGRESFKFRGKESEMQEASDALDRATPSAKHGNCSDRKLAALFK